MKASLCVGEYCENAYNVEGLDIRVYSMEELCYCLKECIPVRPVHHER